MRKSNIVYMFGFIKKVFVVAMTFFDLSNVNSLECVSMNNQECAKTVLKYAKLCVPDVVKT